MGYVSDVIIKSMRYFENLGAEDEVLLGVNFGLDDKKRYKRGKDVDLVYRINLNENKKVLECNAFELLNQIKRKATELGYNFHKKPNLKVIHKVKKDFERKLVDNEVIREAMKKQLEMIDETLNYAAPTCVFM